MEREAGLHLLARERGRRRRKLIEECSGWMKVVGGLRRRRHRGKAKVAAIFTFTCAGCSMVRMRRLPAKPSAA